MLFLTNTILFSAGLLARVAWILFLQWPTLTMSEKGRYLGRTLAVLLAGVAALFFSQNPVFLPLVLGGLLALMVGTVLVQPKVQQCLCDTH